MANGGKVPGTLQSPSMAQLRSFCLGLKESFLYPKLFLGVILVN
jgi:hypothetical protein